MSTRPITLIAVVALALVVMTAPATGQGAPAVPLDPGADPGSGPITVEDPRLDPSLWSVPADSEALRAAAERYRRTERELTETRAERDRERRRAAELAEAQARLDQRLALAARQREKSATLLASARADLQDLAVAEYLRGGIGTPAGVTALSVEGTATARRQRIMVRSAFQQRLADERTHADVVADTTQVVDTTVVELAAVGDERAAASAARDAAASRQGELEGVLLADAAAVADERVLAIAVGTDMPLIVLDAYVRAARTLALEQPECRVSWWLLAGIGRTESRHGTFGGAQVDALGHVSEPILGIPLDGTRSARITDTDGGALDGDPVYDRAVGPMQFIPSTWVRVARDGDGDGVSDPHDFYDAALTAAEYLCLAADGLDAEPGARAALLSYNRSVEYGTTVLERARDYASAVPLP